MDADIYRDDDDPDLREQEVSTNFYRSAYLPIVLPKTIHLTPMPLLSLHAATAKKFSMIMHFRSWKSLAGRKTTSRGYVELISISIFIYFFIEVDGLFLPSNNDETIAEAHKMDALQTAVMGAFRRTVFFNDCQGTTYLVPWKMGLDKIPYSTTMPMCRKTTVIQVLKSFTGHRNYLSHIYRHINSLLLSENASCI